MLQWMFISRIAYDHPSLPDEIPKNTSVAAISREDAGCRLGVRTYPIPGLRANSTHYLSLRGRAAANQAVSQV